MNARKSSRPALALGIRRLFSGPLPRPRFGALIVLLFVVDRTAWAIPSPDVMVNLFASAAQVLGLASLILGRWFFSSRARRSGGSGDGRGFKTAFLVAAGLCVTASIGWYMYYAAVRDQNLERLQVNLNRNSKEEGKKIVDVTLKELSFSDQLKRQDGLTTDDLAKQIAAGKKGQVLDIREDEEYEVGAIEGVQHVRFPDVLAEPDKYIDKGRGVLLLCYNGNRSSELAGHFEEQGYTCRFMIGGYEKWIAEDRPLVMNGTHERKELREIPDYPNKMELLDTPDVTALIEKRNPLFVDVRYPGDFELNHLPGAVNVTMRKLTTPELDAKLAELPKRPVIVPCYDKRSSFFGLVLGLRLHRLGYEFLGRYTTPEGFSVGGSDKPHVTAWKAAHEPRSLLTIAAEPLKGVLAWLREEFNGALALAIIALVLLIRVAIAPLTIKAERDRRVQDRLAPEVAALKARFAGDPESRSRAMTKLFAANGIRPFWNLLAAVAQLLLFTVFFNVVQQAVRGSSEPFLWLQTLGAPDATRLLPILVALLIGVLIALMTKRRVALFAVPAAALVLGALSWNLLAGVNLYLVTSLLLLIVQNLVIGVWLTRRETRVARHTRDVRSRFDHAGVVPLEFAHRVDGCGNKAARLGRLVEAGLPVPGGFVVRARAITARNVQGRFADEDRRAILAAHVRLGAERVAVRSSGLNEDGADKSYAGVFESILDVRAEGLFEALEKVADSLSSMRAGVYSNGAEEAGAIVVQAMVPARFAGVLFTEHPGESGAAAVEMIEGLGDALVSGRAQPKGFRLGRISGRLLDTTAPPIDIAPLFTLGRRVEALFGKPQDIEWAFADERFYLLQARDITRLSRHGEDAKSIRERERSRLLDLTSATDGQPDATSDEIVFAQSELTELLVEPTPFSLAFMDSLWAHGGSTHRACQRLGIPYDVAPDSPPYAVGVFGILYANRREERRRMGQAPSSLTAFRLSRAADEIERAWRDEFLPAYSREARLRDAIDLGRFSVDELIALFAERRMDFVQRIYVRAEEVNIAADFYLKAAVRALEKKGLDPVAHLAHMPKTIVHEAMEMLARIGRGEADVAEFIEVFGHRAPQDYELADARYRDDLDLVRMLAQRAAQGGDPRPQAAPSEPEGRVLVLALQRARRYQSLKEDAKHHALRDVAFMRSVLLEIGARIGLAERIFQLTPDEVERLADPVFRMREAEALAARRLEEHEVLTTVKMGVNVTQADLEAKDVERGGLIPRPSTGSQVRGTRVSGTGDVVGRARVLREADEIGSFQKGEILVARFTDPTWMSVFPLCKGIVTEVGGWLSHAAIQAREYGITAVVGAPGALEAIATGDLVRIGADGTVELIAERRREARVVTSITVNVTRSSGQAAGRVCDRSSSGALLVVSNARLEIGEHLAIQAEGGASAVDARVVRNGIPGIYGIEIPDHQAGRIEG